MGSGDSRPYPRTAIGATLILVALATVQVLPQSSPGGPAAPPPEEMLSELAGRIAAAIAPAVQVHVDAADPILEAAVIARLSAGGIAVIEQTGGVPGVRVVCLDNLRDRVCSADVTGATSNAILVARPRDSLRAAPTVRVALELRPVVSLGRRILDVVRTDDEMLVLTADAVLRYEEARESWRLAESLPIPPAIRPLPRDMRGRLRVTPGRFDLFLPGRTCAGGIRPLTITCADGNAAWPLDIDEAYLDPLRNHFTHRGLTFYGVARLSDNAATSWIAATLDHHLTFVDENRTSVTTTARADDVAGLRMPCFPAGVVVASTPAGNDGTLRAFEVVRRTLVPAAAPLSVSGDVTALWSIGATALVVTHHPDAGRYVANELSVSCSR